MNADELIALLSQLSPEDRKKPLWSTSEAGCAHEPITGVREIRPHAVILDEDDPPAWSPPMIVPPRAVETCVCAWFYAELTAGEPTRSGAEAFEQCLRAYEPELGEEPEYTKMRDDVVALGRERFQEGWQHLLAVLDASSPGQFRAHLGQVFEPVIAEGRARRARRRGQA
jgi:hypothetical protein